jgi:arabinose-5-phosphate isomerase
MDKTNEFYQTLKDTLTNEAQAIERVKSFITEEQVEKLVALYRQLESNSGTLFFCGVGKSGVIGMKLASTFRSLGLRSVFLHPVEALHGDLGLVSPHDAIAFLSKSGTTEEILNLMKYIDNPSSNLIGLLGNIDAEIGAKCGLLFNCSVEKEACLNNQAPTTSSTVALAMGDALAVVYEKFKNLTKEDFAVNHPGGLLGKSLRVKVKDLAILPDQCASVALNANLKDVMLAMTQKNSGGCAILEGDVFKGLMVEGDIRRAFNDKNANLETNVTELMTTNPTIIGPNELASKAIELMEFGDHQFNLLPIVEDNKFNGFIRLHELVKEGFSPKA